ncbi:hypothetical protein RJZ90_002775 [Blastomyces dermatitidis]
MTYPQSPSQITFFTSFVGRLGCDSGRDFSFLSSRTNKTVDAEKQQLKTQEKTKKNTQMPTYCDQACPSGTADSSHTSQEDTGVESGDSIAPEGNADKRCEGSGEDSGRDPESQLADGEEYEELAKNDRGWRKIVRNFTPSWFTVNMGTGIVSILLFNLPYNGTWLYWISVGIFGLNTVLFTIFLAISILRYALWPGIWRVMLQHPVQSLFIGTFPMGFSTVVSMIALNGIWKAVGSTLDDGGMAVARRQYNRCSIYWGNCGRKSTNTTA